MGADQHVHFGTIQSNNTAGKPRLSPTVTYTHKSSVRTAMSPVQKCTAGTVGGFEHSADTVTSGNASEADSDQVCTHKHKLKSACMNVKVAAVLSHCS